MRFEIISVLLFFTLAVSLTSITGSGEASVISEHEPNDSFFEAERIGEGTVSGQISIRSYSYGDEDKNDTDIFVISVPARKLLKLSIERKAENGYAVFVNAFDEDLERIEDFWLFGQPTGEEMEEEWFNEAESSSDIYLNLSGEGTYRLTVDLENDFQMAFFSSLSAYSLVVLLIGVMIGLIIGLLLAERQWRNIDRHMEKWENVRKEGKWRFILVHGVLFWGLMMTLTMLLFNLLIHPEKTLTWVLIEFVMYLIGFSLGGVVWGLVVWRSSEKRYNEWKEKNVPLDRAGSTGNDFIKRRKDRRSGRIGSDSGRVRL